MAGRAGTGFVEIDHSGDVGVEAWGATRGEAIENVTRGLFGLWCRGHVEPVVERTIEVRSDAAGDLLVDWLSEVIACAATRGEVYGDVVVTATDEQSARGVLRGESVDAERHALRFDVKAATYHGLVFESDARGYHARVIFDL
jgi:SHS2 domain-containing protein